MREVKPAFHMTGVALDRSGIGMRSGTGNRLLRLSNTIRSNPNAVILQFPEGGGETRSAHVEWKFLRKVSTLASDIDQLYLPRSSKVKIKESHLQIKKWVTFTTYNTQNKRNNKHSTW